jgi:magnesium transporter
MIKYFYKSKADSGTCEQIDSFKDGAWVHVEQPTEEDIARIAADFDLDEDILLDVLDENEMPRVERDGKITYIFTRHPYTDNELRISTSPTLFVLTETTLLSFTPQKFHRMDRFLAGKIEDFSTTSHVALMLQVLDQVDDEYESKLSSISRQIKSIRSRLRVEEIRNKDFVDFVIIEDVLNEFLSALVPTNAILHRLILGRHLKLKEEDKDIVEDLLLNNEQSIEGCKSSLKTIVNIREAYSTIMSNNLNRIIRILTVLTVIISIPTLVSSIYGMNVNLPLKDYEHAFFAVMSLSFVLSLLLVWFFRWSKWF